MVKYRLLSALASFLIIGLSINNSPSFAIYGGSTAIGNKVVVGLLSSEVATSSGCSGGLVAPRIVMTAAHCLTSTVDNLWISEPGSDLRDLSKKRIQAERIYIPEGFTVAKFPYQNDFGIVVLKSAFENYETLELATKQQIQEWMSTEVAVLHLGYGCTALVDAPPCRVTSQTPNQLETTLTNVVPQQFATLAPNTFSVTKISVDKTICGGDSGGPLLKRVNEKWIYIGAQSSSNGAGCTKSCNMDCAATQGLPAANISMVQAARELVASKSAISTPTVKPVVKEKTITCLKGKISRKASGINPKCPTGFKKRTQEFDDKVI